MSVAEPQPYQSEQLDPSIPLYHPVGNLAVAGGLEQDVDLVHSGQDTAIAIQAIPKRAPSEVKSGGWRLADVPEYQAAVLQTDPRIQLVRATHVMAAAAERELTARHTDTSGASNDVAFERLITPIIEHELTLLLPNQELGMLHLQAGLASVGQPIDTSLGWFGKYELRLHTPSVAELLTLAPGHTSAALDLMSFGRAGQPTPLHTRVSQWLATEPWRAQAELPSLAPAIHPVLLVRDTKRLTEYGASMNRPSPGWVWEQSLVTALVLPRLA